MGQIADIFEAQGQLDEALLIRQEQLPAFERLGDERERAVTMGRIADIFQARGQLDEALRIRQEQLPVFERLGDTRDILIARVNAALNRLSRNAAGDRGDAADLLKLAYSTAVELRIPEADLIRRIQQDFALPR
ncbi:tetratricopeptide repeat protein [Sorangium sp. So ce448]|uniref:tetratricopeptide repeat protein n=1 Tax=Sorangium sp. So ce448 TaxID=3133314 RepID=UPI003F5F237A